MNIKSKIKFTTFIVFIIVLSGLFSCSKKSDEVSENVEYRDSDMENVTADNYNESDEDLMTVDYKEFYDDLTPHGEWIEVKGNDIGVDIGKSSSSNKREISISDLFGVKEAFAQDVNFGAFFVWKPAPNLAVGVTAGEPVEYVPYTNGQWVNTTNGWYFRAASEPEEITHHYGRWVYSPKIGWVWVPGRVWAPAWVEWREQDEYIAWSPIPPSFYIVNNVITVPPVVEERYIIVEKRYFIEPEIYRYKYKYTGNHWTIKEWKRPDGILVINNTVINRGPDVTLISTYTHKPVDIVKINYIHNKREVKYSPNEYNILTHGFKKLKKEKNVNKPVKKPDNYTNIDKIIVKNEKLNKYENNESRNEKGSDDNSRNKVRNKDKLADDSDMKNGNRNNGNKRNGKENKVKDNSDKSNGNKNKQKEKEHQKEERKSKGNDKKDNSKKHESDGKNYDSKQNKSSNDKDKRNKKSKK